MSRYIDADTLKVSITRYAETLLTHKILPTTKDAIKEVISDICFAIEIQSPVDAVHVVRCRDCKYFDSEWKLCNYFRNGSAPEHFCSAGRRKE